MTSNLSDPKSYSELRAAAREQLKGNWGKAVLTCLIFSIITGLPGMIPAVGFIISILIFGPLQYGVSKFFLALSRQEESEIETLFDGFKLFTPTMVLGLLIWLFTALWSLLLVIPGIIAALSYSQAYFIMLDNPGMTATDAIKTSKVMMKGHKGRLFVLGLTFIGWALLGVLTLGIGYLWLIPYINTTMANFYNDLKAANAAIDPIVTAPPENE